MKNKKFEEYLLSINWVEVIYLLIIAGLVLYIGIK